MTSTEHTKIVVRHLPPNLPEQIFWKSLDPWLQPTSLPDGTVIPPKCTATFKYYVPGKLRQKKSKLDIASRAYIQFSNSDQVLEFHLGYTNQAFRDSRGNLTFPKVEFAPYQKVGGPPKKVDSRIGTIESDRDYQAFLATLTAPTPELNPEASKVENDAEKVTQPQVTPLIEHLRNLRKAQEAAASAKQQRNVISSHSSGKSTSGGRTFAGPPQIMKRVVASNPLTGPLPPKTINDSSAETRDEPPHILTSSSKESKRAKHSSPLPLSSSNLESTSTTNKTSKHHLSKSRPIKSLKSKKEVRGGEDFASTSESRGKNLPNAKTQQPKKILQPPKSTTDSAPPAVNGQKSSHNKTADHLPVRLPKSDGNSSAWKDAESERDLKSHRHHNVHREKGSNVAEREGPKKSGGRGGGGMGRGGRGGKSIPNNKSINPSSHPPLHQHDTTPSPLPNPSTAQNHPKSHDQSDKFEPNKNETAAARRRLGMALAGIASKPDRTNSSSSRKDGPSKS